MATRTQITKMLPNKIATVRATLFYLLCLTSGSSLISMMFIESLVSVLVIVLYFSAEDDDCVFAELKLLMSCLSLDLSLRFVSVSVLAFW